MYANCHLRFYTKTIEETAEVNLIIKVALQNCKHSGGVYRFSVPKVAALLGTSPFEILTVLQQMQ